MKSKILHNVCARTVGAVALAVVLAVNAAGCSKSSEGGQSEGENPAEDIPIRAVVKCLNIEPGVEPGTKGNDMADFDRDNVFMYVTRSAGDFGDGQTIQEGGLYVYGQIYPDATDPAHNPVPFGGYYTTGNTKLTRDGKDYYAVGLIGWWLTFNGSKVTSDGFAPGGPTPELMIAPQVKLVDGVASLTFKHLLAHISVKVRAEDQAAIDAWGELRDVYFTKVKGVSEFNSVVTVDLVTGEAPTLTAFSMSQTSPQYSWNFTAYDDFTNYVSSYLISLTTDAFDDLDPWGCTMIAPVIAEGKDTDFELVVVSQPRGSSTEQNYTKIPIALPAGDMQGKDYTIRLTFKATEIDASASVGEWGVPESVPVPVD